MDALILPADAGVSNVRAKRGVIALVARLVWLHVLVISVIVLTTNYIKNTQSQKI